MEAALRSLGTVNRRDRIRRYVQDVAPQSENGKVTALEEDSRMYTLDRSAILESRRGRRRAQRLALSARCEPLQSLVNPLINPPPSKRRRATDENARRAERTLGRAAHLRPGRITLLPPNLQTPAQTLEQDSLDFWDQQEHSAHSNQMHIDLCAGQGSSLNIKKEPAVGQLTTSKLFNDFYLCNPSSLSNGWLAERHHREVLATTQLSRPLPSLAKLSASTPLLGLCPLARKKAERRR